MNIQIPMPEGAAAPELVEALWRDACAEPSALDELRFSLAEPVLPSVFRVADLATATTAAAGLAAMDVHRTRGGLRQSVRVDSRHAEVAFLSERYLDVEGEWRDHHNPLWGYYRTRDGRWGALSGGAELP